MHLLKHAKPRVTSTVGRRLSRLHGSAQPTTQAAGLRSIGQGTPTAAGYHGLGHRAIIRLLVALLVGPSSVYTEQQYTACCPDGLMAQPLVLGTLSHIFQRFSLKLGGCSHFLQAILCQRNLCSLAGNSRCRHAASAQPSPSGCSHHRCHFRDCDISASIACGREQLEWLSSCQHVALVPWRSYRLLCTRRGVTAAYE